MRVENSVFTGGRIELDNNEFLRCTFQGSTLVYSAKGPVSLQGCSFADVTWAFEGAAALTLQFMQGLYHGAGRGGHEIVERTFENIRRPTSDRPHPVYAKPLPPDPGIPHR